MTEQLEEKTIDLPGEATEFKTTPAKMRSDVDVALVDMMGGEHSITRRARVSVVGKDGQEIIVPNDIRKGSDEGLIRWLYKNVHGTPFEGVEFEWYFRVPVFVSRQIVKHRLSSINEESGRYRVLDGEFYVEPPNALISQQGKTGDYNFVEAPEDILKAVQQVQTNTAQASWDNYNAMIQIGVSKETARKILPVSIYSSMYFKCNLRSLLNFVALRKDWGEDAAHASKAQREIEMVTDQIVPVLQEKLPTVWDEFVKSGYVAV